MEILSVFDAEFKKYGRVLEGLDVTELLSELEKTENEPNWKHMLQLTVTPEEAPDKAEYVQIDFEKGIPVAVNGKKMSALDIMLELNRIGGRNGVGLVDICENRCVGMKSRGVYETPGGAILYYAHEMLDHLCLDRLHVAFTLL